VRERDRDREPELGHEGGRHGLPRGHEVPGLRLEQGGPGGDEHLLHGGQHEPEHHGGPRGDGAQRREVVNFEPFEIADVLDAARPPNRCETTANASIYVCVQARSSGNVVGIARGRITLSTARPGKPTDVSATAADDGALEISWKSPTGDPPALDFDVVAIGPVNTHTATEVRGERFVMTGLENFVAYTINVYAVSEAGNVSDKSDDVTGTPAAVLDWWEWYRLNGGLDSGGCGAGGAGPLALLGVAALLAALRRRRA
jgi:uncharacterized protein (TIGR03382 family)